MYFGDSFGFLPKVPYYDQDHPNPYGFKSPFYTQTETAYDGSVSYSIKEKYRE
jgi:hypothetical protein